MSKHPLCRSIASLWLAQKAPPPQGHGDSKGSPRGPPKRHEPCLKKARHEQQGKTPAVSAVRVNGDAIAVKERHPLPRGMVTAKGPLEGRDSGTSHAQGKATTLPVDCAAAQRRPPQQ